MPKTYEAGSLSYRKSFAETLSLPSATLTTTVLTIPRQRYPIKTASAGEVFKFLRAVVVVPNFQIALWLIKFGVKRISDDAVVSAETTYGFSPIGVSVSLYPFRIEDTSLGPAGSATGFTDANGNLSGSFVYLSPGRSVEYVDGLYNNTSPAIPTSVTRFEYEDRVEYRPTSSANYLFTTGPLIAADTEKYNSSAGILYLSYIKEITT